MDTGHLVRPEDLASSTINNSTAPLLALLGNQSKYGLRELVKWKVLLSRAKQWTSEQ